MASPFLRSFPPAYSLPDRDAERRLTLAALAAGWLGQGVLGLLLVQLAPVPERPLLIDRQRSNPAAWQALWASSTAGLNRATAPTLGPIERMTVIGVGVPGCFITVAASGHSSPFCDVLAAHVGSSSMVDLEGNWSVPLRTVRWSRWPQELAPPNLLAAAPAVATNVAYWDGPAPDALRGYRPAPWRPAGL